MKKRHEPGESLFTDHQGKPSSSRVVSIGAFVTASVLALAPLWGGPAADFQIAAGVRGSGARDQGMGSGIEARETIAEVKKKA